jgi:hypothetical protein
MVDDAYMEPMEWIKKSFHTTAKVDKFSSDREIMTRAEEIWNIEPVKIGRLLILKERMSGCRIVDKTVLINFDGFVTKVSKIFDE